MKIYIVRHGETVLNANGVMQGRLDEPLKPKVQILSAQSAKIALWKKLQKYFIINNNK